MNYWLSRKETAKQLAKSVDTVSRWAVPWSNDFVEGKIRWKWLVLDAGGRKLRRYFRPDVAVMLPMPQRFKPCKDTVWLRRKDAARKISVSGDTIERRALPWSEHFIPGKIRWQPDEQDPNHRRYYEPDLEAMLVNPKQMKLPAAWTLIPAPLAG